MEGGGGIRKKISNKVPRWAEKQEKPLGFPAKGVRGSLQPVKIITSNQEQNLKQQELQDA